MKRLLLTMFIASAVLCSLQSLAAAQGCGGNGFWGFNRYYANPYYPSDRRIPYFAEHPPVYYSHPVARTYGYSPYASPPTYTAPEVRVAPVIMTNPYVPQAPADPAKADTTNAPGGVDRAAAAQRSPGPLMVFNPYVQQNSELTSPAKADTDASPDRSDRSASVRLTPAPLVVVNPFLPQIR